MKINLKRSNTGWESSLLPINLGPVYVWLGIFAKNLEVYYRYLHVYPDHIGALKEPCEDWLEWAQRGWHNEGLSVRDTKEALYIYHEGKHYNEKDGFEFIFKPLYKKFVRETGAYTELKHQWYLNEKHLAFEADNEDKFLIGILLEMLNEDETKYAGFY